MSYASDDGDIEVAANGVRVQKGFEAEDFPVPAMRFAILCERDEAVTVRISDEIPEDFSMDGVGFHPDYEGENWTAYEDNRVEYERTLQPGEQVVTVYGVRANTMEEVRSFLVEPTVEEVRPAGADVAGAGSSVDDRTIEDIAPKESNQVVRDVLSGDRDSLPGMGEETSRTSADGQGSGITAAEAEGSEEPTSEDSLELGPDDAEDLLGDLDDAEETAAEESTEAGSVDRRGDPDEESPAEDSVDDSIDLGLDDDGDGLELDVEGDAEPAEEELEFDEIPETDELEAGDDDGPAAGDPVATDSTEETGAEPGNEATARAADAEEPTPAPDTEQQPRDSGADRPAASEDDQTPVAPGSDPDESTDTAAESSDPSRDGDSESAGASVDLEFGEESETADAAAPSSGSTPESDPTESTGAAGDPEAPRESTAGGSADDESTVGESESGSVEGVGPDEGVEDVTDRPTGTAQQDPSGDRAGPVADSGSVVDALLEELQDGTVDDSDLADLRAALGTDEPSEPSRSMETRLSRLESRMEEFDAYTDALREFIDEEGTAEEIIGDIRSDVSDLREEVSSMSDAVSANEDGVDAISEAVDGLESDLASTSDDVSTLEARVDDVDAEFEALVSTVEGLETDVETARADLQEVESAVADLRTEVGDLSAETDAVDEKLDAEIKSLRSNLESIEEDVTDLVEWRGQLGEMFK